MSSICLRAWGRARVLRPRFAINRVSVQLPVLNAPLAITPNHASRSLSTGKSKSKDPISFDDTATAFRPKTNVDIFRAMLIFRLTCIPFFVRNSGAMVRSSYRFLGENITNFFLRRSIFKQFCGGDDLSSIIPTVQQLRASGIRAILDYAVRENSCLRRLVHISVVFMSL